MPDSGGGLEFEFCLEDPIGEGAKDIVVVVVVVDLNKFCLFFFLLHRIGLRFMAVVGLDVFCIEDFFDQEILKKESKKKCFKIQ